MKIKMHSAIICPTFDLTGDTLTSHSYLKLDEVQHLLNTMHDPDYPKNAAEDNEYPGLPEITEDNFISAEYILNRNTSGNIKSLNLTMRLRDYLGRTSVESEYKFKVTPSKGNKLSHTKAANVHYIYDLHSFTRDNQDNEDISTEHIEDKIITIPIGGIAQAFAMPTEEDIQKVQHKNDRIEQRKLDPHKAFTDDCHEFNQKSRTHGPIVMMNIINRALYASPLKEKMGYLGSNYAVVEGDKLRIIHVEKNIRAVNAEKNSEPASQDFIAYTPHTLMTFRLPMDVRVPDDVYECVRESIDFCADTKHAETEVKRAESHSIVPAIDAMDIRFNASETKERNPYCSNDFPNEPVSISRCQCPDFIMARCIGDDLDFLEDMGTPIDFCITAVTLTSTSQTRFFVDTVYNETNLNEFFTEVYENPGNREDVRRLETILNDIKDTYFDNDSMKLTDYEMSSLQASLTSSKEQCDNRFQNEPEDDRDITD